MFAKSRNKPSGTETDTIATAMVSMAPAPAPAPAASDNRGSAPAGAFLLDRNKPSVISEGFALVGDVVAEGVLHVEGSIKGTINSDVVNIGLNGAVDGDVRCKSLQIKGSFVGTARCDELIISGKAHVSGRVAYGTLSVQRGATIEGDLIQSS